MKACDFLWTCTLLFSTLHFVKTTAIFKILSLLEFPMSEHVCSLALCLIQRSCSHGNTRRCVRAWTKGRRAARSRRGRRRWPPDDIEQNRLRGQEPADELPGADGERSSLPWRHHMAAIQQHELHRQSRRKVQVLLQVPDAWDGNWSVQRICQSAAWAWDGPISRREAAEENWWVHESRGRRRKVRDLYKIQHAFTCL